MVEQQLADTAGIITVPAFPRYDFLFSVTFFKAVCLQCLSLVCPLALIQKLAYCFKVPRLIKNSTITVKKKRIQPYIYIFENRVSKLFELMWLRLTDVAASNLPAWGTRLWNV